MVKSSTSAETTTTENSSNNNNNSNSNKAEWVRLNIGGKLFVSTKTTLCKNPNSFFFKLLQDDPSIGLTTDKVII